MYPSLLSVVRPQGAIVLGAKPEGVGGDVSGCLLWGLEGIRLGWVWEVEEMTDEVSNSPRSTAAPATSAGKPEACETR